MRWRNARGANLVEMALVVPFLLLLLVGVVDLGRAFYSYIAITNAAREGARMASRYPMPGPGPGDPFAYVKQFAINEAQGGGITLTMDAITVSPGTGALPGNPISVTVEYTVTTILGGIAGFGQLPMRSTTSMVAYGQE